MGTRRALRAAVVAVVLAMTPGALQVAAAPRALERAPLVVPDTPPGRLTSAVPATAEPSDRDAIVPPAPPPPEDAVAVVPPSGPLTGELAPPGPPPATFAPPAPHQPGTGEVVALVVGIDDYPGTSNDLHAAAADASTIDAALDRFGVPLGSRVVLRDGQATREQVVTAIQRLVARARPGSTMVFAFAGHVQKLDADTEAMVTADGALLTDQELATLLAPAIAARTWLLLATCYAGGFTEALGPGRILTGASGADELAYESPRLRASYLVHHMVREGWLEGRAGPSVQAAFAYADGRIAQQNPDRRPVLVDHVGEPLVLGQRAAPPDPGAGIIAAAPAGGGSAEPDGGEDEEMTCLLGVLLCRRR